MQRLALITAACAAIISVIVVVASSGAQQPGPPTGTLELLTLDRETRFAFVDNPPRRRERSGDLFVINGRLRDSSNRPVGRVHALFAETKDRSRRNRPTAAVRPLHAPDRWFLATRSLSS
jgi:hypothetical protein